MLGISMLVQQHVDRNVSKLTLDIYLAVHEPSAVAIVEENIFNSVVKLLKSLPTNLHWDIYLILSNLVSHKSTMTAVLDMFPYNLPGSHWCKSVDGTALVDPLASSWEGLVIAKWLDGRCKAAAKATCNSLVALVW
ncbi:hypothetical protein C8J57DRAFT_1241852 [Mycena rebaudengoi]|nr:hypothetical protein C8J57DRAFT_1241852 [Mycena rebaudengoi]